MASTEFNYPWEIDNLAVDRSGRYHPGYESGKNTYGPHTDADYDMEGPFGNFIPNKFATSDSTKRTSLEAIKATGNPTRAQVQQAMTRQFAA